MLKPTPERIKAVMRKMPKGLKYLDEIQKAAMKNYGIAADETSLLETLREIYREGKLEHVRHASGKDRFDLDEELKGLTYMPTAKGGMFLDWRVDARYTSRNGKRYFRKNARQPLLAWLNCRKGVFSLNIVSETLKLTRPIPKHIRYYDEAVDWVLRHAEWVDTGEVS